MHCNYHTVRFYSYVFITTTIFWLAGAWMSFHNDSGLHILLMLPGLCAPFIISAVMMLRHSDRRLWHDFVDRLLNLKRLNAANLGAATLLMLASVFMATGISVLFGGDPAQFGMSEDFSFTSGVVPVLLLLLMAATFEELGWRGYAFDALYARRTFLQASLLFGVLWSAWHLPLIAVKGAYQYEIWQQNTWYAVNFYVSIIPMGVIISWVCVKNRSSVLAAILFHFIINLAQECLNMNQETKTIQTGVLTIMATLIIVYDHQLFFSTEHLRKRGDK